MIDSEIFQVVDFCDSDAALQVPWLSPREAQARLVDAATLGRVDQQVTALESAERHTSRAREVVISTLLTPAGPGLAAAQRALGESLFELLDGPDRALTRRLEAARRGGTTLHLVVRLRAADHKALVRHRALRWHLPLVAAADGPLALAPKVTIAVQIGDAQVTPRETVPGGRLQVLFMA